MKTHSPGAPHMSTVPDRGLPSGIVAAVLGAVALIFSACGSGGGPSGGVANLAASSVPATVHTYMTILTGEMINNTQGPTQGPKYVPADVSVPRGTKVILTITSYDDGPASFSDANSPYLKVTGGTETVGGNPVTSVTNDQIAHTFTVPSLGINVPVPASPKHADGEYTPVTVTFSFTASQSGTFSWLCFAPCGTGTDGMGSAMATAGYMKGTITVT